MKLAVLDSWDGQAGNRYLQPGNNYRRVARVRDGRIVSGSSVVRYPGNGIGNKAEHDKHLDAGRCVHEDIRGIFRSIIGIQSLREEVVEHLASTTRAVVVDEIFDANKLDLELIKLFEEADLKIVLIGDPWQALYEFRGAEPGLVDNLVTQSAYKPYPLTASFRFRGKARERAIQLRSGSGMALASASVDEVDVVLAPAWRRLWTIERRCLPLSFGSISNSTDAVMTLLLDQVLRETFGLRAIYVNEALNILRIDSENIDSTRSKLLTPALNSLLQANPGSSAATLAVLRERVRDIGAPRKIRKLTGQNEQHRIDLLQSLRARLLDGAKVLGMTVHQAKGREWNRVGVALGKRDLERVKDGLSIDSAEDRLLYVALTRARDETRLIASDSG